MAYSSKFKDGELFTPEIAFECMRELFLEAPGPLDDKYLVLAIPGTGIRYLSRIINCKGHRAALELAQSEYNRKNLPSNKPIRWLVHGKCQNAGCECGGKTETVEYNL
jgi:hypothetical protein